MLFMIGVLHTLDFVFTKPARTAELVNILAQILLERSPKEQSSFIALCAINLITTVKNTIDMKSLDMQGDPSELRRFPSFLAVTVQHLKVP